MYERLAPSLYPAAGLWTLRKRTPDPGSRPPDIMPTVGTP
jgi:hypothetical protein